MRKGKTGRIQRILEDLTENKYPVDKVKIREDNIKYLFVHSIHFMRVVRNTYDSFLSKYRNNHNKAFESSYEKLVLENGTN